MNLLSSYDSCRKIWSLEDALDWDALPTELQRLGKGEGSLIKIVHSWFQASMQYLLMGAYFSQDNVNLEGFSNFFFEHADEERTHGVAFMDYLRLRGDNSQDLFPEILPILGT